MGIFNYVEIIVVLLAIGIDITRSSSCHWKISTNKTYVYQIGDTLTLSCTYFGADAINVTDTDVLDPHGHPMSNKHVTGNKTITVSQTINDCSQGGTYVCKSNHCNRTLINTKEIRVEDSSQKPNLECVVNRYYDAVPNMTCSWQPICENNYFQWILLYKGDSEFRRCTSTSDTSCVIQHIDNYKYEKECVDQNSLSMPFRTSCTNCAFAFYTCIPLQTECIDPDYADCKPLSESTHCAESINIYFPLGTAKAFFSLRSTMQYAVDDMLPHICVLAILLSRLKLIQKSFHQNRTYLYTFIANESSWRLGVVLHHVTAVSPNQLNLTVDISDGISDVQCAVLYTSEWENITRQMNYSSSSTSDLTVDLPLYNLEPFTQYALAVKCRTAQSPYWSKSTKTSYARTQPQAPIGIPGNILFADEIDASGRRQIYLYWTPILKRYLRGNQTVYAVTYIDSRGHHVTDIYGPEVVTAILNNTFQASNSVTLHIDTRNEAGIGYMNKTIEVPSHFQANVVPVVSHGQNSSNITVFWDRPSRQSGQTLLTYYWCQGTKVIGHAPQCHNPMHSKMSTNQTESIHTAYQHGNLNWFYGVSIRGNGLSLERIMWSDCSSFTNTIKDSIEPVVTTVSRLNSSTIDITIDRGYCDFDKKPEIYQVAVLNKDTTNCSGIQEYDNYTAKPSMRHLSVRWQEDQKAYVCVRILFGTGQYINSEPVALDAITTESTNEQSAVVAGVSVAVVMIALLAIAIGGLRYTRRLQALTKIEDVQIIIGPFTDQHSADHKTRDSCMTETVETVGTDGSMLTLGVDENVSKTSSVVIVSEEDSTYFVFTEDNSKTHEHIKDLAESFLNDERNGKVLQNVDTEVALPGDIIAVDIQLQILHRDKEFEADVEIISDDFITDNLQPFSIDRDEELNKMVLPLSDEHPCVSNESLRVSQSDMESNLNLSDTSFRSATVSSNYSNVVIDSYVQTTIISPDQQNMSGWSDNNQSVDSYVIASNSGSLISGLNTDRFNQANTRVDHHGITRGVVPLTVGLLAYDPSVISSDSAISSSSRFSIDSYVEGIVP